MNYRARSSRPAGRAPAPVRRGHRARWTGAVFNVAVLVAMLATATIRQGFAERPSPLLLVLVLVSWLPLTVRNRWPFGALVATLVTESLHLALMPLIDLDPRSITDMGAFQPVPIATTVAAYTFASRSSRRDGWTAGIGSAAVLIAVSHFAVPGTELATSLLMFDVVILATAIGALVAGRRERVLREALARQEETRREVAAERLRIARELHDVLAHNLTLVNAQAGVAGYLLHTDPPAAEEALRGITEHTRRALDELRATVGLLRQEGDQAEGPDEPAADALRPVPGVGDVDELVRGLRAAGADIVSTTTGTPRALSSRGDLAAYRILQEALTNAAKHAPGSQVHVELTWTEDRLVVDVVNGAPAVDARPGTVPGSGHGLIGMNERATAAGGSVRTGRTPGGGFHVVANLPTTDEGGDISPPGPTTRGAS
ncbi:sensor histidine kinase [Oerskovia sp. Root22]|uniref:sensor histidine kinase n=1 Tax=Oerskovia sp. Root22 TaxID=1736494 RepID=UPI0006FC9AD9|nr:sensor histidine kinase [Oerskovia sp. Root22]KRC35706.1 hypothetical protein ASE15_11495 [Oerskovia sp. Root22]